MQTNEKRKSNIFKIIFLITTLSAIIFLAQFAWAKYMAKVDGNAQADIAQWNFNVTAGSEQNLTIDLAKTRYDKDTDSVDRTTVAPGTYGKLILNINANVTDVSLRYDIDLDIGQIPQNLIFYSDEGMKNAIYHSDNNIHLEGFFSCNENNKTEQKILYWKWPMETGQTEEQINFNDGLDSEFIGRNITIAIQVVGSQVKEIPNNGDIQVTFDANGGIIEGYGNSKQVTKTVTYNEQYGEVPTASMEGYKFAGWCGKNLLGFKDRIIRNPGGDYNGTRNFTGNGIYIGISANNYYFPTTSVNSYNIDYDNNSVEVLNNTEPMNYSGYGIGFDYKVLPDTHYIISKSDDSVGFMHVAQYDKNGEFITSSSVAGEFTTEKNACWILIVVPGTGRANEIISINNIQLEQGDKANEYTSYCKVISNTIVDKNENHKLTAIWIKE